MVRLRVPLREARAALNRVEHSTFLAAVDRHWNVGSDEQVSAQSVCWLFCWGKTGMSSNRAAEAARRAFHEALDISFDVFDVRVPHEWARHERYELGNIEAELNRFLVQPEKELQVSGPSSASFKYTGDLDGAKEASISS